MKLHRPGDRLLLFLFALLALSLALNVYWMARRSTPPGKHKLPYPFLAPDVQKTALEDRRTMGVISFNPLRGRIETYLSGKIPKRHPGATSPNPPRIGIYVEDLITGSWMGIMEKEIFLPLSLNKVTVAMAAMKKVDAGEWKLDQTFLTEENDTHGPPPGEDLAWREKNNGRVTLSEALERLLTESDNDMLNLIGSRMTPNDLRDIRSHIGMIYPEAPRTSALSPKNYSNVFRSLYYATCLTRNSASYLLDLMSRSIHVYLLRSAIPSEISVAHKFGIFYPSEGAPPTPEVFLHEVGIVYYPQNPFLIAVMTKQMDRVAAGEMIRDISKMVYEYYEELKKGEE